MKLFILLFTFSLTSLAQYPFNPKKEEVGRKGLITLKSNYIPKKYQNLWSKTKYNIPRGLPSKTNSHKHLKDTNNPFSWTYFIDESLDPKKAPGVLILITDTPFTPIPEQWKKLCKSQNLILAAPDFSQSEKRYACSVEMTFCMLDLIRSRFPICESRIFYVALSNKINHLAHMYCPSIFSGTIGIMSNIAWDSKSLNKYLGKSKYSSFVSEMQKQYFYLLGISPTQNQEFINHAASNNGGYKRVSFNSLFFKIKGIHFSIANPDKTSVLKTLNVTKGTPATLIYSGTSYSNLSYALNFLNSKNKALVTELISKGKKYAVERKFGLALKSYWESYALNYNQALELIKPIEEALKLEEIKAMKLYSIKNYFEANALANKLVNTYSAKYAVNANIVLEEIKKDKNIIFELKAAAFLSKAEAALKQSPPPKDKIKAACEKVIQTVPGTFTAKKAQKILDGLN